MPSTRKTDPDEFDAFYKDARGRLLLQTYALTGDLPASRSAVRDSFVMAWHHWSKVARHPDPEAWVRPHAWAHAQRRHTARLWHRDKGLDPEVRATLDALGKLPVTQRKALLLNNLVTVGLGDLARELGLPRAEAERALQTATAQFSIHRDVASTGIRRLFEPMREQAEQSTWPRPTILRRAGAARRRTHTIVGAAVAVAVVVVSGSVVTDAAGERPTLAGRPSTTAPTTGSLGSQGEGPAEEPLATFTASTLLTATQVSARVPGRAWSVEETSSNTAGDGLVMPCQQQRYADPRNRLAFLRTFATAPRGKAPGSKVIQVTELSGSDRRAERAFGTALDWYAGCTEPRVQLLATHEVTGVADDARLLVLRSWAGQGRTYVAGVARTGLVTTVTVTRTLPGAAPAATGAARLLARAVTAVCDQPDAGACAGRPRVRPVPPEAVGVAPGMLAEVDLPPVAGIPRPWVGTQPRRARFNVADTSCDRTEFSGGGITHNLTRSFVIPGTRLPDEFGLTESVGTLPVPRARAFVSRVRARMDTCPDRQLGTDVVRIANRATGDRELGVWRVTTEVSDKRSVTFLMGVVREGSAVAQVGFVPHLSFSMGTDAFVALVERAGERLRAMPRPR